MKEMLIAISFLTKLPIPKTGLSDKDIGRSSAYFPLAGLVIAAIIVLEFLILKQFFPMQIVNLIVILSMIFITGAIHIDGLADTMDGLGSKAADKDRILSIMRDPKVGVMGVIAVVFDILLKYAVLNSINIKAIPYAILSMCLVSRWAMSLSVNTFSYARTDGLGKAFIQNRSNKNLAISGIFTLVVISLIFFPSMVYIVLIVSVFCYLFNKYLTRKIGGITGDTLGAVSEIAEILTLLLFVLIC